MAQSTSSERADVRASASTTARLWRNLDFTLLWTGQLVSTLGTSISTLALPLLVLALTRSPAQAGFVSAVRLVPYTLLSLPAGVLVDRWNRKAVMIRVDLVRWLALGSVPLAFAFGRLTLLQVYAVALIEGSGYVFFSLAQLAALPRVVAPGQLSRAYALSEASDAAGTLVGPGLGGYLISLARTIAGGSVLAYLADSLSYLLSVLSLQFVRAPFQVERGAAERVSLRAEMAAGLRFLLGERRLRLMALLTMAINILTSPIDLAVIVLARGPLHVDVRTLGLIFSVAGAGGLASALVAPAVRERVPFGRAILACVCGWAVATVVLAIAGTPLPVFVGRALVSVCWPIYAVVLVTYRLALTPDALQGRVNSAFRVVSFTGDAIGPALGGLALAAFGPRAMLAGAAVGLALCALYAASPAIRKAA